MISHVRRVLTIVAALALLPAAMVAQEPVTITGQVTSEAGQPLPTANVRIPELGLSVATSPEGRYRLVVPAARARGQQAAVTARTLGYGSQTVRLTLTPGATIAQNFQLASDPLRLEEVVVTGAGTVALAERLGTARATVDAATIERANEPNVIQALAGKLPNVVVNQQSGDAGASTAIRIRGMKTIGGTGQPLIVVDGVPVNNATRITGATILAGAVSPNRAGDINPDDIESVEVLSGAAATSIYGGSAGSSGAILITTKQGRPGRTAYSLRSTYQSDRPLKYLPVQQRFGVGSNGVSTNCTTVNCSIASSFFSWGPLIPAGTPTFDHGREIYETGKIFDNTLSMSGGGERTSFYVSAGVLNHDGFIASSNDYFKRHSFRFNGSHAVSSTFTVGASGSYVQTKGNNIGRGNSLSGILGALRQPPDFNALQYLDPVSGLHRSWRFPNPGPTAFTNNRGFDNPFYAIHESQNDAATGRYFGNINANYTPLSWLTLNYQLGADYTNDDRTDAQPISASGAAAGGQIQRWQFYDRLIDHSLVATGRWELNPNFQASLTLGQNLNETYFRQISVLGRTWIAPQPFKLQNTVSREPPDDAESRRRIEGYFAQSNIDLFDQLFLQARVRNDGNSALSRGNQRAWYPGASAAWSFTKAMNLPEQLIGFGKLRLAYGETGQQPPLYTTQDIFINTVLNDFNPGSQLVPTLNSIGGLYLSATQGNPDIKPERVRELEGGIDLNMFGGRADFAVTRYVSRASDVILPVNIAPSTGYTTAWLNAAKLDNKGWEISSNFRPIQGNFGLEIGANWAMNRNKVLSLGNPEATAETCGSLALLPGCEFGTFAFVSGAAFGGQSTHAQVGYPFGVWRGTDFARCGRGLTTIGTNNIAAACAGAPDGALFIAANGYPIQDPNTRVVGSPEPNWTGGLSAALNFRGFELSAFIDHRQGGDVLNMTRGSMYQYGTHGDTDLRGEIRTFGKDWLCQNRTCTIFNGPVVGPGAGLAVPLNEAWFTGLASVGGPPSGRIEDATNTRLREVSLSYSFTGPGLQRLAGVTQADIKIAGRNLKLWSDYTGFDPETNVGGAAASNRGIDWFNNPLSRALVLSIALHH